MSIPGLGARSNGVLLAAAAALLVSFPHFAFVYRLGLRSVPVPLSKATTDEQFYMARVYSVFRGHWWNGTTCIREHENDLYIQPNVTEAMTALLLWPFRGSPHLLAAAGTLLFTFLTALSLWWAFSQWSPGPAASYGALLTLLLLGQFLHRVIQPQGNYFVYVCAFGLLYRLRRVPRPAEALLYGAALGALCYFYIYYFMFLGILTGLVILESIVSGRRESARCLVLALCAAAAVCLPFALHNLQLRRRPGFAELFYTNGWIPSRFPSLMRSVELAALIAAVVPWIRDADLRVFFGLALLAGLVAFNQQLVTGVLPPEADFHFWRMLYLPLAAALLLALGRAGFPWPQPWALAVFWACLAACQAADVRRGLRSFDWRVEGYVPAFEWLDGHAGPRDVVVAETAPSAVLPFMTGLDVFRYPWEYMVLDRPEILRRNFRFLRFYGMPDDKVKEHVVRWHYYFFGVGADMQIGRDRVKKHLLDFLGRLRLGGLLGLVRGGPVDQASSYERLAGPVMEEYGRFKSDPDGGPPLRADYLVYGPCEREVFPGFSPESRGEVVYRDAAVAVVRLAGKRGGRAP